MQTILIVIKGLLIAGVSVMPSISGGTLAITLGLYDRLVYLAGNILSIMRHKNERLEALKFLIPFALGGLIGLITFARLIRLLINSYPQFVQLFMVGLLAGSLPLIIKRANFSKNVFLVKQLLAVLVGIVFMTAFFRLNNGSALSTEGWQPPSFNLFYGLKILAVGIITAAGMVIPGLSGSLILVILGEYANTLAFFNQIIDAAGNLLRGNFNWAALWPAVLFMTLLCLGLALGTVAFARLVNYALKKQPSLSFSFICGVLIASVVALWPPLAVNFTLFIGLICALIGFILAYTMSRLNS
ncbi:MAG: DUF368 domain-containing protein [Spirochaetaceae bacterium]|nr:DUF368 domain-containing protein [Spirochaetaceae bacterium]